MHWPRAPRQAAQGIDNYLACRTRNSACISVVPLFQVQVVPETILGRLTDPAPAASFDDHHEMRRYDVMAHKHTNRERLDIKLQRNEA